MRLNHPVGQQAEELAFTYLKQKKYVIIKRNWHCPFGEIDIIASHGNCLVFVEVKYRAKSSFGGIQYTIPKSKLKKISLSIDYYLMSHPFKGDIRVDAILIEGDTLPIHLINILDTSL